MCDDLNFDYPVDGSFNEDINNDFSYDMIDVSDDISEDVSDTSDVLTDESDNDISSTTPYDITEDDILDASDEISTNDIVDVSDDMEEDIMTDSNEYTDNFDEIPSEIEEDVSSETQALSVPELNDDVVSELSEDSTDIPDTALENYNVESNDYEPESDIPADIEENMDIIYGEFDDRPSEDTYFSENQPSMSDDEMGNFVDWENEYGDQIQEIQNDPTLSDDEKSVLLSSAYDDFTSGGDNSYSDADLDADPGVAKTLTYTPNTGQQINSYNDIGLNDATDNVTDVNEWLGDINPNYDEWDPDSPYSNNCGSCAYAVWNRLNGIDSEMCATAENIGYNSDMETLTGMEQVPMSPEDIENTLLAQGDGANAIIGIDRAEGFGHWFNAACIDGKVVAIDGQTGEINDWPPDYGDVINWEMSIKKGA